MVAILVLIKQVPIPREMKTSEEGFMARTGVRSMINPYCKHALEEALKFRDKAGGTVTVLTMGPRSFEQSIHESLSLGADEAYLLSDRRLAGSDTMVTARALSMAIKKIGTFDMIFAGVQTIDGDTGHVGPEVAERLDFDQVTYITRIEPREGGITAWRLVEYGVEVVETSYPVLVTVTKYANVPRGPSLRHAMRARKYRINQLTIDDIGMTAGEVGKSGSPTIVSNVTRVNYERPPCKIIEGPSPEVKVTNFLSELLKEPAAMEEV